MACRQMHGQRFRALDTNRGALYVGAVVAMTVSAHAVLLDRGIGIALITLARCIYLKRSGRNFRPVRKSGFSPAGCGISDRRQDKHHQRQKYGKRAQGNRAECKRHGRDGASNIGKWVEQGRSISVIYKVILSHRN